MSDLANQGDQANQGDLNDLLQQFMNTTNNQVSSRHHTSKLSHEEKEERKLKLKQLEREEKKQFKQLEKENKKKQDKETKKENNIKINNINILSLDNNLLLKDFSQLNIAQIIYNLHKENIIFDELTGWYFFNPSKHRWIENNNKIIFIIGREIIGYYHKLRDEYINLDIDPKPIINNINKLNTRLFKNNIISECKEIFINNTEEPIIFNQNNQLIHFNNGIFDGTNFVSQCDKNDYISYSTLNDYPLLSPSFQQASISKEFPEIDQYLKDIIKNPEDIKHINQLLISLMRNDDNSINNNIYVFKGGNSRTKFIELLELVLNDYIFIMPLELISQKRGIDQIQLYKNKRLGVFSMNKSEIRTRFLLRSQIDYWAKYKIIYNINNKKLDETNFPPEIIMIEFNDSNDLNNSFNLTKYQQKLLEYILLKE
jgi:hypothetical protein